MLLKSVFDTIIVIDEFMVYNALIGGSYMDCNICNNEFKYVEGLKFCPYCGSKLNVQFVPSDAEDYAPYGDDYKESEREKAAEAFEVQQQLRGSSEDGNEAAKKKAHDTLEMPLITDEIVSSYNEMNKKHKKNNMFLGFLSAFTRIFTNKKVIIGFTALIVLGVAGFLTVNLLSVKAIDETAIKEDIVGKVIVLPKGSSFQVKKGDVQEAVIIGNNSDKDKQVQYLDVKMTLNNKSIEVKGTFRLTYKIEGKNQRKLNDKIELKNDIAVKPVIGMEEAKVTEELKKQTVSIGGENLQLSDGSIKTLKIAQRTPNFDQGKEELLAEISIDNGIMASTGNIKASLIFENENWKLDSVAINSDEDFKAVISPSMSEDTILSQIKKKPLQENVAYSTVFGGKEFAVNDKFTKSMKITDKNYDQDKKVLNVTVKRENSAGIINSTLTTNYSLNVSFKALVFGSASKSKVESVTVSDISRDNVAAMLVGAEMKMGSQFLWWSESHTITADEAKTLKINKSLSRKNAQNTRYVYGDISYQDGKKAKTASIVAIFLVSGSSDGYAWKLDSVISSEADQYQYYRPEVIEGQ